MRSLKRAILFALGLTCGVVVAFFIVRHRDPVYIHYYFGKTPALPLWAVTVWAFAMGATIPVLLHFAGVFELFLDRRRLTRRINELEKELVELRNLPLTEAHIDIERPRPAIRSMVNEPREVQPEVVTADEMREADLYPAVYETRDN